MPGNPRRIYFAHPVTTYGTTDEADALVDIRWKWAPPNEWEIVNPNEPHHARGLIP